MFEGHQKNIQAFTQVSSNNPDVEAVIIGGSIAHGFAVETSDIDVMLVVPDAEFQKRREEGRIQFLDRELHIDGKYISREFIRTVGTRGNEATRYSFSGAFTTYSRVDDIESLIRKAQEYPKDLKIGKMNRFYGQFKAWNYYCKDSIKKKNQYLIDFSISNLILFGGRLVLAHNEMLFPYHKWFLGVLEKAPQKPDGLMASIDGLLKSKNLDSVEVFHNLVDGYHAWNTTGRTWPNIFIDDSEWKWLNGDLPVSDL
jgi:predicted nucleotidyltransferase